MPKTPPHPSRQRTFGSGAILLVVAVLSSSLSFAQTPSPELTRTVRPWEFLSAVGTRAGLLGDETGRMEAWVYPLKIFRNLHLLFEVGGRVLPAEPLARTLITRPESSTVVFAGDTFTVRETFFVPVQEPGAVVRFEIESEAPLNVRAVFERDFQLEWPAALGGTFADWNPSLHAFYFGEEQKKFAALIGSPTAANQHLEYQNNYSSSNEDSFDLGATTGRHETRILVLAGSVHGLDEVKTTYEQLASNYSKLQRESSEYYRALLARTVNVELPDAQLQQGYDWSRISMMQGLVNNPYLGTGLIAGYRTSGNTQRPGFAWFFGRDSLWTALALDAEGDFGTTRTALDFLSKYQREDGKISHEIAQGASFVDWFKSYPYPYASADATPLYLIATNDYVTQSGDLVFAQEKWDSLWRAYQFLHSTFDAQGLPQNFGIGHGWVEGGPLLPVKTELYQAAVAAAGLRDLANLARLLKKDEVSRQLAEESNHLEEKLNRDFWLADKERYAFAIDQSGMPVDEPSVLATVPMWFGLLRDAQSQPMITELAAPEHQADWGMRIISTQSKLYSGGGYHFGSVWPLFTGWASVGEYRYHRALPAFMNLRANALLALDGSLGHVTEVLSGDEYQGLATSSPNQIWSAAMVVSPLLRGLFGLSNDAQNHVISFSPHVPADWKSFVIHNLRAADCRVDVQYTRTDDGIVLVAERGGTGDCTLEFSPAISPIAEVMSVESNGHLVPHRVIKSASDQHVSIRLPLSRGANKLYVSLRNDFGLSVEPTLPPLGTKSLGLRVLSDTWSATRDRLDLEVAGIAESAYDLELTNASSLTQVDGAKWARDGPGRGRIRLEMPKGSPASYVRARVVLHFGGK
jgi:glycogen debranching enzyme